MDYNLLSASLFPYFLLLLLSGGGVLTLEKKIVPSRYRTGMQIADTKGARHRKRNFSSTLTKLTQTSQRGTGKVGRK